MVPTSVLGVFGSVLFQRDGAYRHFERFFGNVIFQRDSAPPSVVIMFHGALNLPFIFSFPYNLYEINA